MEKKPQQPQNSFHPEEEAINQIEMSSATKSPIVNCRAQRQRQANGDASWSGSVSSGGTRMRMSGRSGAPGVCVY